MCDKKKFYHKDNKIFRSVRRHHRKEKRFYWCKYCKCWHLTSEEKE